MSSPPEVRTAQGVLRGSVVDGVRRFAGVPFAAPPVGDLRWAPPQPPQPWAGVRDAVAFGGSAIPTIDTGMVSTRGTPSEDCLYLNIWTTDADDAAGQPVMVWIHGGGFLNGTGSAPEYDGAALARRGVTVVTVNYRLGVFGYAAHPGIGANAGLLDQVAALRWVAQNIVAFGGDPTSVTVFGQSAGAASVRALLSTPSARGLFHRAIIQSAGFEDYAVVAPPSYDRSLHATARVFDALGTSDLDALRRVPADVVRAASFSESGLFAPHGQLHTPANLVWYPVADDQTLFPDEFSAWSPEIPVMLGWTADEARFFVRPDRIHGRPDVDPAMVYTPATLATMARALGGPGAEGISEHYRTSGLTTYEALADLVSAAIFVDPAVATLQRFAALDRTTYAYEFARVSPGARATGMNAFHTCELPYLFGLPAGDPSFDATDTRVAEEIQTVWTTFARSGVPAGTSGAAWTPFTDPGHRIHRICDDAASSARTVGPVAQILNTVRAGRQAAR